MKTLFGPQLTSEGVEFRFWAPKSEHVLLKIADREPVPMDAQTDGWHFRHVTGVGPGSDYLFIIDDGTSVPDPASRFQPGGPHGPSEVIDPRSFAWSCPDWKGLPWEKVVIYELHIGAFTNTGTFRSAIEKLPHLKALGVTALQLMPVNDFPGRWGWGYDGVLPFAPYHAYGRPDDLKALVDAAHAQGLGVFFDVIYNHFGPDGNFLPLYAPLFTDKHRSPWGDGVNYDGDGSRQIRDFVIENALYWLLDFRADGLRLDAVHAIVDDSREHLLHELARRIHQAIGDRQVHLIVENEENDSTLLSRDSGGVPLLYTAQWNDDIHHALHVAATGEDFGYYADYAGDVGKLGRAMAEGFAFQGEHMPYRGAARGTPTRSLPPTAFISFIQNHDQIGNRALGDRMVVTAPPEAMRALAALYLLSPQIPMLFMGEEWGSSEPFPYFCDFNDDLNEIVRKGRKKELSRLPGFAEDAASAPDPTQEATFRSAKLRWERSGEPEHSARLSFYRRLLETRHREIVPRLAGIALRPGTYAVDGRLVTASWFLGDASILHVAANLGPEPIAGPSDWRGRIIWPDQTKMMSPMPGWAVVWSIE